MKPMRKRLLIIFFGSTLIGIGINGFILPFHLINGGIFGISLLLNYLYGLKLSLLLVLLNIPIYLLALKSDPHYFINGVIGAVISGFLIELMNPLNGAIHLPIFASVICGGVLIGVGVGLMLRNHISPGGMDLLALLISKWSKLNVGIIIYLIDTVIIVTGLVILKDANLLYSLIIVGIVGLFASILTSFRTAHIYFH
ncbi:YitT family protein [Bacillus sp. EB600]|uniref:YitT family protein n=1 Tax=Bacillus sp. EB600 TaxID=2806345 RepID=UPI00210962EF|nr:YitT family protein [Bacillus sp. EB600]